MSSLGYSMNAPARRPVLWLGMLLACAILAGFLVRRLHPDVSLEAMTSSNDPASVALDHVLNNYSAAEELLLLVSLPESQPADIQPLLSYATRLEQGIAVDPVASKQVTRISYRADPQTRAIVEKVIGPAAMFYLTDEQFEQAKQRLTREGMAAEFRKNEQMMATPGPAAGAISKALMLDPLRLHEFLLDRLAAMRPIQPAAGTDSDAFLSPDGRSLLIRIAGNLPPSQIEFAKEMTASVTRVAQRANTGQLRLDIAGAYPIAAHSASSIRRDSIISICSSVASLAGLFALSYRTPIRLFLLAMAPVVFGVLLGFGAYSLFRHSITPLTAVIGGILAGIGIDYSIQYITYYHRCRSLGLAPLQSTSETVGAIGTTAIAAWATSIVGFFAIGLSSVRMLRDFALAGAASLAGAFVCTLIILPAMLVLFDRRRTVSSDPAPRPVSRLNLIPIVGWIALHQRLLITICILLMCLPFAWLAHDHRALELESDLTILHPRPNPPLDAQDAVSKRMGISPGSLLVHLSAGSNEKLLILAHDVQSRLSDELSQNAGITSILGLSTFLPDPRLAAARIGATGTAFADHVIADFDAVVADSAFKPEAFAPYRSFLRILLTQTAVPGIESLGPYDQLRETFLSKGDRPTDHAEAITLVFTRDSLDRREDRQRVLKVVRSRLADLPGAVPTGMAVLSNDIEASIRRDLPRLILAAIAVVAVYLLIHFRSLTDAFLALLPTFFSFACVLAAMQLTGQRLNLVNIVSIPLLIGIDVDYGIFLVGIARLKKDANDVESLLATSGQAVLLCAATTVLGFGSIYFTSIPAIQSLGLAVSAGVIGCAFAALFLLTPILLMLRKTDVQPGEAT